MEFLTEEGKSMLRELDENVAVPTLEPTYEFVAPSVESVDMNNQPVTITDAVYTPVPTIRIKSQPEIINEAMSNAVVNSSNTLNYIIIALVGILLFIFYRRCQKKDISNSNSQNPVMQHAYEKVSVEED